MSEPEVDIREQAGLLRLPNGVSVGDEFRVVGRVRVSSVYESILESHHGKTTTLEPGARKIRVYLTEIEIEDDE